MRTLRGLRPREAIPREDKGQVSHLEVVQGGPQAHLAGGPLQQAYLEKGGGDHELCNGAVDGFEGWARDDEKPPKVAEDGEHKCVNHNDPFRDRELIPVRGATAS